MYIEKGIEKYASYCTEHKSCLICGENSYSLWAIRDGYTAVECRNCRFVWINPSLNKEGLDLYYNDYIGMRAKDLTKTKQRQEQYILDKNFIELFVSAGVVLDLGCAGGDFLSVLNFRFEKFGTDIDKVAIDIAKKRFPYYHFLYCQDMTHVSDFFDLVVMRGVVEHLSNPLIELARVSKILKKGGYLYIATTPNIESFCADIYRHRWNQFHPIRHLSYFTAENLAHLCSKNNLTLVARDYPYLGTPYANPKEDAKKLLKDLKLIRNSYIDVIDESPPFWGNTMNLVFKRT